MKLKTAVSLSRRIEILKPARKYECLYILRFSRKITRMLTLPQRIEETTFAIIIRRANSHVCTAFGCFRFAGDHRPTISKYAGNRTVNVELRSVASYEVARGSKRVKKM